MKVISNDGRLLAASHNLITIAMSRSMVKVQIFQSCISKSVETVKVQAFWMTWHSWSEAMAIETFRFLTQTQTLRLLGWGSRLLHIEFCVPFRRRNSRVCVCRSCESVAKTCVCFHWGMGYEISRGVLISASHNLFIRQLSLITSSLCPMPHCLTWFQRQVTSTVNANSD